MLGPEIHLRDAEVGQNVDVDETLRGRQLEEQDPRKGQPGAHGPLF